MLRKLIYSNLGKKRFQVFFEKLHKLSLLGMNCGTGSNFYISGEKNFITQVRNYYAAQQEQNIVLFDVGANRGEYSRTLLQQFDGLSFHIFAFEPGKDIFRQLAQLLEKDDRVSLYNLGLSNEPGNLTLYKSDEISEVATLYKRENRFTHGFTYDGVEEIELITLDDFCTANNIEKIHFLKMDIEGHEFSVLQGATAILENVDFIQFEFSAASIDSRTYLADFINFLNSQFRLYRVLKDGLRLVNYDVDYEVFSICNYVAVNKSVKNFTA